MEKYVMTNSKPVIKQGVFKDIVFNKQDNDYGGWHSTQDDAIPLYTTRKGGWIMDGKNGFLYIPNDVTVIEEGAFSGNTSIRFVFIAGDVTAIHRKAFKDCLCLKKIFLPESVTQIGSEAFANCRQLQEINVPATCEVSKDAFDGCPLLY